MGWAGHDIMDGDTPMDYEATIREEILGLHWTDDEELPTITEEALFEAEDGIGRWCKDTKDPIAYEVWAWMLLEAESESITEGHRVEILAAIDEDITATETMGWTDPTERKHCLRLLREKVEVLGTGTVVSLPRLLKRRLSDRTKDAMQGALDATDPSVVQKAVARMLMDLESGDGLDDWGFAAAAIVGVGKALAEAVRAGVPLEDAVETARQRVGA